MINIELGSPKSDNKKKGDKKKKLYEVPNSNLLGKMRKILENGKLWKSSKELLHMSKWGKNTIEQLEKIKKKRKEGINEKSRKREIT